MKFVLESSAGEIIKISSYLRRKIIEVFYVKDNTQDVLQK